MSDVLVTAHTEARSCATQGTDCLAITTIFDVSEDSLQLRAQVSAVAYHEVLVTRLLRAECVYGMFAQISSSSLLTCIVRLISCGPLQRSSAVRGLRHSLCSKSVELPLKETKFACDLCSSSGLDSWQYLSHHPSLKMRRGSAELIVHPEEAAGTP